MSIAVRGTLIAGLIGVIFVGPFVCFRAVYSYEKRLREVVTSGGFTKFRRATQTPFNLVFEARP